MNDARSYGGELPSSGGGASERKKHGNLTCESFMVLVLRNKYSQFCQLWKNANP